MLPKWFSTGVLMLAMSLVAAEARAGAGSVEADGDLNLNVVFRFIPAQADIDRVQGQLQRVSRMLCDATEGRMRIRKARLTAGGSGEPAGDIWYYGPGGLPRSSSSGAPVHNEGNRILLGYEAVRADVVTHELGHLVLGLGDQYDEQRRFGGPCGIGPSFDATDEVNHTIMQQSSYQNCRDGGGVFTGTSCYEDADCPAGHICPLSPLMSEFSVSANFDQLRGDSVLAADTCPSPVPGDRLTLRGPLYTGAAVAAFDGTDFSTAEASAAGFREVEFIDSLGNIPLFGEGSSILVSIFAEHTGSHTWTLHFGMDEGRKTGGTEGDLLVLDTIDLEFSAGGALEKVDGVLLTDPAYTDPVVSITGLADGAADADLAVEFDGLAEQGGTDVWWLWGSEVTAGGLAQLGNCTATAACQKRWNTGTRRWEASAVADWALQNGQTPLSDWEWMVANVGGLYSLAWPLPAGPNGLPAAASPVACANADDVDFEVAVSGADQVAVIIDRSGSMEEDREYLGDVRTRLDWAKAGARAFADVQTGSGMAVSLISFDDVVENELGLAKIELDATATAADHKLTDYKAEIDALTPRNSTAIGDALFAAKTQLLAAAPAGKAVLLLTDGENNAGTHDPQAVSQEMRDEGIQVFAVPVGNMADSEFLARMAAETGGTVLGSEEGLELPMVFVELYARLRGEVPVLGRTPSAVRGKRTPVPAIVATAVPAPAAIDSGTLPEEETFEIPVELGAQRLNVVLSARNALPGSWNPAFRLEGPGGEVFDQSSPGVLGDEFYRILRVPSPARGIWRLTVASWTGADQFSYLLGHVEGPGPDCYAGASPRVVPEGASQVLLAASSSLGAPLGRGVGYEAVVERPAGAPVAVPLVLDDQQVSVRGTFSSFAGRGLYEAVVECRVTGNSRYSPGEHATLQDLLDQPRPEPFVRQSRTSFFVDAAELPPLGPGGDQDHDGIPDSFEGSVDTDGDGLPDAYDQDADGDDLPDSKETDGQPGHDTDGDGRPDFRDPDADNDGVIDGADPDPFQPGSGFGKGGFGKGRWRGSLHVGSAHPLRDLDHVADANIYVQGDLGYRLLDRLDLKARLGFAQFTAEASAGIDHPHWLHASLDLQLFLPPVSGLTPFVQAGPGWYRGKGGSTDIGLNLGAGLQLPGAGTTRWEVGTDYHWIDDVERTRFFTIHLGVLFP
jgi:hypothetical protein